MQLSEQQIKEWQTNLVTRELAKRVVRFYENMERSKLSAYHAFEPQKTQEILAGIVGALDTWYTVEDLLTGDWDSLELDDERESNTTESETTE